MQLDSERLILLFMEQDQSCFHIAEVYDEFQEASKGANGELLVVRLKNPK